MITKDVLLAFSMSMVYVLTTPIPKDGGDNSTMEQIKKRAKWDNNDYVCKGFNYLIFSKLLNLEKNYGIPWRPNIRLRMHQVRISLFTQHKMNMDEAIQGSYLRIEESLRAQDSDKPKGNNVVGLQHLNGLEKAKGIGLQRILDLNFNYYLIEGTRDESKDVVFLKEAINDEMDSIMGNNTWVLADLPPGCKPLGCKWIFKRKFKYHKTADCFDINSQSDYSSDGLPPKESTIAPVITPTQGILVYSRRPKASRSVGSSSKVKNVESNTPNSTEPNQS
ncbi:hypothetical protein Tco_0570676 [Tanacetum coccineum]